MNKMVAFFLAVFSFLSFSILRAEISESNKFDLSTLAEIPILHEGRIKPLDTFARVHLLAISGKTSLKNNDKKISAIEWMFESIYEPEVAFERRVFDIKNSELLEAFKIEFHKSKKYTFNEVSVALRDNFENISKLYRIDKKQRSPVQNQMVDIYMKTLRYYEIARSFSLVESRFLLKSTKNRSKLNLDGRGALTYLDLNSRRDTLNLILEEIRAKGAENLNVDDRELLEIATDMSRVSLDNQTQIFRIIPPQFKSRGDLWFSPWRLLEAGEGTPLTVEFFDLFKELAHSYKLRNYSRFDLTSKKIQDLSLKMAGDRVSLSTLKLEVNYSKWELFYKATGLYILSFLLLSFSFLFLKSKLKTAAFLTLIIGFIPHTVGLILRCIIMQRPPVTTLYESIIFVSAISVLFSIILQFTKKDGMGTFIGSILGPTLLFVSFGYLSDGDSMGMLAAVLDTNFWLATHVVTITIGYGCCYVAGILGHVYLIQTLLEKVTTKKFDKNSVGKNMLGASLVALFFCVLGTILGGIWADQSWGRFWGWDPKENGAMLICLWLLLLLHGRLAGLLKNQAFAAGLVICNIVVALAWFGVNLLAVGLHSYGFTENIAMNLLYFCSAELLFVFFTVILIEIFNKKDSDRSGQVKI